MQEGYLGDQSKANICWLIYFLSLTTLPGKYQYQFFNFMHFLYEENTYKKAAAYCKRCWYLEPKM